MISAKNLLNQLKREAIDKKYSWHLSSFPLSTQAKKALNKTQSMISDDESFKNLNEKIKNVPDSEKMKVALEELSQRLMTDIKSITHEKYNSKLAQIELGFIPTGVFDAFCINQEATKLPIDGFVIAISQGLFFSLQILVKSMILENLNDELIQYKTSGEKDYNHAIELFLQPETLNRKELFFNGLPEDIQGELAFHQNSISTMILKFVALHEVAHIVNNDFEILGLETTQFYDVIEHSNDSIDFSHFWDAEFKADEFALNSLCAHISDPTGIWANFSVIYFFFYFLSDIEKIKNKQFSLSHPSAKDRAETLLQYMIKKFGKSDDAMQNVTWVQEATKEWYSKIIRYN
jgi:hypothetical protein